MLKSPTKLNVIHSAQQKLYFGYGDKISFLLMLIYYTGVIFPNLKRGGRKGG